MEKITESPIVSKPVKFLGSTQRQTLQFIEVMGEPCTFNEIFEALYQIPLVMGAMLEMAADMRLAVEGKSDYPSKEAIFKSFADLMDDVEGYIRAEDAQFTPKREFGVRNKIYNVEGYLVRWHNYLKLQQLENLRKELASRSYMLSDSSDVEQYYEAVYPIGATTYKLAESIEGYRQELRRRQAIGRGNSEADKLKRALSNRLKASLIRTIRVLKSRGFLEEIEIQEKETLQVVTAYSLTQKGFETLESLGYLL